MEPNQFNFGFDEPIEEPINLRDQLDKYLVHWKWFLVSIALTLLGAFIYLKFTQPTYEVSTSVLIKDEKNALSEFSAFEDLGMLSGMKNQVDDEIEVLKSRTLIGNVVKELELNLNYYSQLYPVKKELFTNKPIKLSFLNINPVLYTTDTTLVVRIIDANSFRLSSNDGSIKQKLSFGTPVTTVWGPLRVNKNQAVLNDFIGDDITISISPINDVIESIKSHIEVETVSKKSNVILLKHKTKIVERGKLMLDNLVKQYNQDAVTDKNLISANTAAFINDRLILINDELSDVEKDVETYKSYNNITDISSEAKLFLENASENEKKLVETNTQLRLVDFMNDYIAQQKNAPDLIPANLGFTDPSITTVTTQYNQLVLERNRILKSSSERNPVIISLNDHISKVKEALVKSLANFRTSLQITIKELNKQEARASSRIATVPKQEREFRNIQRQQQIKETLYLYLLQKREETAISLAVTVSNAKTIDKAYSSEKPIAPKKNIVMLAALLLGFLLPIVIIYIQSLLDSKVHFRKDIEKLLKAPFLGDVPQVDNLKDNENYLITKEDRSSTAEALRLVRTNLDFMLTDAPEKGRRIFVTSTISNEGKSFIAINLGVTLANFGKKVLLVGMDLRNPHLNEYLNIKSEKGLTHFLKERTTTVKELITKVPQYDNLDFIGSGIIPPNPAELLTSKRIEELLKEVSIYYDYIIVDTAPISLVTDTLMISNFADLFIYVVRANHLDKRMLHILESLYKEKRLNNMAILLNGTDSKKGYGYGYGYEQEQTKKKTVFEKIFNK